METSMLTPMLVLQKLLGSAHLHFQWLWAQWQRSH